MRFEFRYRGWNSRPFIRFHILRIGATRLFNVGPIALFVTPACKQCHMIGDHKMDCSERGWHIPLRAV